MKRREFLAGSAALALSGCGNAGMPTGTPNPPPPAPAPTPEPMANNTLLGSENMAGPLGSNWTAITGLSKCQVVGGFSEPNALSTYAGQVYTATVFPNDHISEATITVTQEIGTVFELLVRIQSGAFSGYKASIGGAATPACSIQRMDAGTGTVLANGSGMSTFAAGDIWQFVAAGSVLALYQNGTRVAYFADATYTGGSPGFDQYSAVNVAHTQGASWRGYSIIQQDGIWTKQGVILPCLAADFASSGFGVWNVSNILYEGNAQLISPNPDGKVYKMWFNFGGNAAGNPGNTGYAEANVASGPWTRRGSAVLANFTIQAMVKIGSTYYGYGQTEQAQGSGTVGVYTSPDGITWTSQNASFLSLGTAGQWDAGNLYIQCNPVIIAGVWNFLYGGGPSPNSPIDFASGIATSPDGITTATKYGSNPVLSNAISGPIVQVGSTYYTWPARGPGPNNVRLSGNAFNPAETVRYSTTDMRTFSALAVRSLHCSQLYEAVNDVHGNATSCIIIDVGGRANNFYVGGPSDNVAPQFYQISLAIAPAATAQIVTQNEDAVVQSSTDNFTRANGPLGANWATPTGGTPLTIVSNTVQATVISGYDVMYNVGSFPVNHYAEITVPTLVNNASFAVVGVRIQAGSNSGYVAQIQGPIGSTSTTGSGILKMTNGATTLLSSLITVTPAAGDVFRLAVTTTNGLPVLSLYQNGALLEQCVDLANTYPTGAPGIGVNTGTLANTAISKFAGGSAAAIPNYSSGGSGDLGPGYDFKYRM